MTRSGNCSMTCPFTRKACTDCAVYRGRHHYFMFAGSSPGAEETKELIATYFQGLEKVTDPFADNGAESHISVDTLLELIDRKN